MVSWAEWETVQRRLARNKADASRNAKRTYWLRGMVFCAEDGRRMVGHARRGGYSYECPGRRGRPGVLKCGCPNVSGPMLESTVWNKVATLLGDPATFKAEMDRRLQGQEGQESEAQGKIADLNRRLADVDHRETGLVALRLRGTVSEVALDRNVALLRAERTHLNDELDRQREAMATLEQGHAAVTSLEVLREHICDGRTLQLRRIAGPSWRPWRRA